MRADLMFGVFEVDLQSRELRKRGLRLSVPDQSFEILTMLLARPGEVVTREAICQRLWPEGAVVDFDHSVNSAVKRLRDRLGDSAITPRFIETLPRIGYRFLVQVEKNDGSVTLQPIRLADGRQTSGRKWQYPERRILLWAACLLLLLAVSPGFASCVRRQKGQGQNR